MKFQHYQIQIQIMFCDRYLSRRLGFMMHFIDTSYKVRTCRMRAQAYVMHDVVEYRPSQ